MNVCLEHPALICPPGPPLCLALAPPKSELPLLLLGLCQNSCNPIPLSRHLLESQPSRRPPPASLGDAQPTRWLTGVAHRSDFKIAAIRRDRCRFSWRRSARSARWEVPAGIAAVSESAAAAARSRLAGFSYPTPSPVIPAVHTPSADVASPLNFRPPPHRLFPGPHRAWRRWRTLSSSSRFRS